MCTNYAIENYGHNKQKIKSISLFPISPYITEAEADRCIMKKKVKIQKRKVILFFIFTFALEKIKMFCNDQARLSYYMPFKEKLLSRPNW